MIMVFSSSSFEFFNETPSVTRSKPFTVKCFQKVLSSDTQRVSSVGRMVGQIVKKGLVGMCLYHFAENMIQNRNLCRPLAVFKVSAESVEKQNGVCAKRGFFH